jgi:diguanylate cyclase (GGDEF)-like protein/PAS domain S-box-containing protein
MSTHRKGRTHTKTASPAVANRSAPCGRGSAPARRRLANTDAMQSDLNESEIARRSDLLQAVTESSARLLAAESLEHELPQVLSHIAGLVQIDRVLVVQEMHCDDGATLRVTHGGWVGPNAVPLDLEELRATFARTAEYEHWLRPLYDGKVLSATRTTAVAPVRAIMTATGAVSLLLVPIRVGGQHWGHIGIDDCRGEREWGADETDALRLLAGVVGAAITRERSLTEVGERDALLQALTTGINDVLTAGAVKEVLPRVLESIGKVTRIDRMLVVEGFHAGDLKPKRYYSWSRDGVGERANLYQAAEDVPSRRAVEEWALPLGEGKSALASLGTASSELARLLKSVGLVSLLLVPIMVRGRIWGTISFDDCGGQHQWRRDEINSLHVFADLIGAAITRERAAEQILERDELLQAVTLSAGEIVMAPSVHEAISNSLERVARAVRADRMLLLEVASDPAEPRQLLHRNSWHAPGVSLELDSALSAATGTEAAEYLDWVRPLTQGETIRGTVSGSSGSLKEYFRRRKLQSTLVVPIMVDGKYWGQISFDACGTEREWTSADTDILKTLASLIGTTIKRERYVEELANANTIVQNSPTVLFRLRGEPAFPMIYISQNVAVLGYGATELLKSPTVYQTYVHPKDRSRVQATVMAMLLERNTVATTIEYRIRTGSGATRWVENRYTPVRDKDGRLVEVEGVMIDITERKATEEKITRLARTDALTGLANRSTFADRLKQAFAAVSRGGNSFAVLYLDLDRFKEINDTLGHPVGDRLLQSVAERLRRVTRQTDVIARLGGDEFAVLQPDTTDATSAGVLAAKIIDVLSMPYPIDGNELRVGVSVGISQCSPENKVSSADDLLAQADQALYRAKEEGRGQYRFHSAELDSATRERVILADELRQALEHETLQLYYQPQVELSSGRIIAMEALVRWNHPTRGLMLPEVFLPIAEKCGLMRFLGRWVLAGACRQLRLWRDAGADVPLIAVNVGFSQVRSGRELVEDVKENLLRYGLRPSDLELDVTELVLARATLAQNGVLEELHDLGVRIAIDDFGTEYSSLDYLRTYNVARLKIARPLVVAATNDRSEAALIRAIMSLAAELGVEVVAEGVENQAQRNQLIQLGARTEGQGFLFAAPMPADQASKVLCEGELGRT